MIFLHHEQHVNIHPHSAALAWFSKEGFFFYLLPTDTWKLLRQCDVFSIYYTSLRLLNIRLKMYHLGQRRTKWMKLIDTNVNVIEIHPRIEAAWHIPSCRVSRRPQRRPWKLVSAEWSKWSAVFWVSWDPCCHPLSPGLRCFLSQAWYPVPHRHFFLHKDVHHQYAFELTTPFLSVTVYWWI